MTGGLWRLTGQQVAAAAASLGAQSDAAAAGPAAAAQAGTGAPAQGGGGEEVRGPHAALAVKLAQRDPGRPFLLGERIQYVLLSGESETEPGARSQAEVAPPILADKLAWKRLEKKKQILKKKYR